MGTLGTDDGSQSAVLRPYHLVGRSKHAHLHLEHPSVSGQHACFRWIDGSWELQDLGSRNGTVVNGRRIPGGERVQLARGAIIRFGAAPEVWQLQSDAEPVEPSIESPVPPTLDTRGARCPMADLALTFELRDGGERIELTLRYGEAEQGLRSRAHHHVLLALAQQRLADLDKDPGGAASAGWIDQQLLQELLEMDTQQLNLNIYRARKQFADTGVLDPENIVERRATSRELRIGTAHLVIRGG